MTKIASLATIATLVTACSTTSSDSIKTRGIWADMGAYIDESGETRVYTVLYVDEPIDLNFIELTGGDELLAVRDGETKKLEEAQLLGYTSHGITFDGGSEGDEIEIQFLRSDGDDAPSSVASIPAPFVLDPAPATASRAAALTLTWTSAPARERMGWTVEGNQCVQITGGDIEAGATSVTIPANTLKPSDTQMPGASCEIAIQITRYRTGEVDPAFKDGAISGQQRRRVTLTSTP